MKHWKMFQSKQSNNLRNDHKMLVTRSIINQVSLMIIIIKHIRFPKAEKKKRQSNNKMDNMPHQTTNTSQELV